MATSKRIHDTLNRGEGITTLVLNYRAPHFPLAKEKSDVDLLVPFTRPQRRT